MVSLAFRLSKFVRNHLSLVAMMVSRLKDMLLRHKSPKSGELRGIIQTAILLQQAKGTSVVITAIVDGTGPEEHIAGYQSQYNSSRGSLLGIDPAFHLVKDSISGSGYLIRYVDSVIESI